MGFEVPPKMPILMWKIALWPFRERKFAIRPRLASLPQLLCGHKVHTPLQMLFSLNAFPCHGGIVL
jgi:hypothetical protein